MPALSPNPTIGIIILAAGSSSRMGKPKQLLEYQGETLLHRAIQTALESQANTVSVVLGANASLIAPTVAHLPIALIENEEWEEGIASSIRAGLEHLQQNNSHPSAVLLMLCDQPLLTSYLLNSIIDLYLSTGSRVIAANYGRQLGVPALFDHSFFPELLSLQGPAGAKKIIQQYSDQLTSILFFGGNFDIDTPEDFHQLATLGKGL